MPAPYPEILERLIESLARFPGIGAKSAERIMFYLLKADAQELNHLIRLLTNLKESITFCKDCHNLSQRDFCRICEDPGRDRTLLCVVEEPKDLIFIEKSGAYHGLYHVLLGHLAPLEGIGPKQLRVEELFKRIGKLSSQELILATNSHAEGEATALYLSEELRNKFPALKISRIARGIPMGSHLEYLDPFTVSRAMEGRTPV